MTLTKSQKKIAHHFSLALLTSGASVTLGFLSFGGMLALWPVLPLAFGAFVLSVAYEGEIYQQNITSALAKLVKPSYLQQRMANDYLLQHSQVLKNDSPQFFKDYQAQCQRFTASGGHSDCRKALRDMEKWFARQLTSQGQNYTGTKNEYQQNLQDWLKKNKLDAFHKRLASQSEIVTLLKLASGLSAIFMGFGTTYLLVDAFSAIPLLAALTFPTLPLIIVPLSFIAGAAYGLLTYNAMSDFILNNRVTAAFEKIKTQWQSPKTRGRSILMGAVGIMLGALAFVLTFCTAGTWLTITKETRPIFSWMLKIPNMVMGIMNPLIMGVSALAFNLQNTAASLKDIEKLADSKSFSQQFIDDCRQKWQLIQTHEHWTQRLNPFRIIISMTVEPLRWLLFLGHIGSIGLTANRVPGLSNRFSSFLGTVSEGFEDMHYFLHGDCHAGEKTREPLTVLAVMKARLSQGSGHNHDVDLPSRLLKWAFLPVYALAAFWDWKYSQRGETGSRLSWSQAWKKQLNTPWGEYEVPLKKNEPVVQESLEMPVISSAWMKEQALYRLGKYSKKQPSSTSDIMNQLSLLDSSLDVSNMRNSIASCVNDLSMFSYINKSHFLSEEQSATSSETHDHEHTHCCGDH